MYKYVKDLAQIQPTKRINQLKDRCLVSKRWVSFEQALIITKSYRKHEGESIAYKRAWSFYDSCLQIEIGIDPDELIVGNRTKRSRDGVVFPEGGISWLEREIDNLPTRNQDPFEVDPDDRISFFRDIVPYWRGKTLEEVINSRVGDKLELLGSIIQFNQTDHAQGHIAPDCEKWLKLGPAGLIEEIRKCLTSNINDDRKAEYYECSLIVLRAAQELMRRYGRLASDMSYSLGVEKLKEVSTACFALAERPAKSYYEALQSIWFLFVLLQMESNASSFSPGRLDQILLPYFESDISGGVMTLEQALEYTDALWLKFNQIVYLRSERGARYFAGFPIGFNIAIGGKNLDGTSAENKLSYLFLRATEHIHYPQPNLSARLSEISQDLFLNRLSEVISRGGGMPQLFNDEIIVPSMIRQGVAEEDAWNYCIVGCVELTTQGNNLGWSDAAMFNIVKVLELTLNDGKSMIDNRQLGPSTGYLWNCKSYEMFEEKLRTQVDYFIDRMIPVTHDIDRAHAEVLPSAFLSSVIDDCIKNGTDVTAGGAKYNFSGIQLIQVANIADSLAALKKLVFDECVVDARELHDALIHNFSGKEILRQKLLNWAPKYGNDVAWVDDIASKWHLNLAKRLETFANVRGGRTQTGLYTVSAHVPMGLNVAATPDGRYSGAPLADGGVSAVYGRDKNGPTAVLNSVSKLDMSYASNGSLLNMKFLPDFFKTKDGIQKFSALLRLFVRKKLNHCQINVVNREDLVAAQKEPEKYGGLTIRVAGYTAFFVELDRDLQDEIIARTVFGG